jgi:hypothetical protein
MPPLSCKESVGPRGLALALRLVSTKIIRMKNWIGIGSEKGQTEAPVRGDSASLKMCLGSGQGQSSVSPASSASFASFASSLLPFSTRHCYRVDGDPTRVVVPSENRERGNSPMQALPHYISTRHCCRVEILVTPCKQRMAVLLTRHWSRGPFERHFSAESGLR